jgi:hypothetical protein
MPNSMMVIFPYKHNETWVFDDRQVRLLQEPFVSDIPEIIDILVQDITDVDEGFKLLFSVNPFPGYQIELTWLREEYGGNWYCWRDKIWKFVYVQLCLNTLIRRLIKFLVKRKVFIILPENKNSLRAYFPRNIYPQQTIYC